MNRTAQIVLLAIFVLVPLLNFGLPPLLNANDRFADDASTRVDAAGYAFAIWGVIFTGMLGFAFSMRQGAEPSSASLDRAAALLSLAGIASILFVPISIYGTQLVGWLDILLHLVPLIFAHRALRQHAKTHSSSERSRWWYFGPSMYLGWISAATVISTALAANELGIKVPSQLATIVAVAVVVILAFVAARMTTTGDPIFGATICWALIAVGVEQSEFPPIRTAAWIAAGTVLLIVIWKFTQSNRFYPVATQLDES